MKKNLILLLFICFCLKGFTQPFQPEFSVAGFFPVKSSGREVYSMNPSWRFHKGDVPGAEKIIFDDSNWEQVSIPHSIDLLPTEASGCINYQGICWYRKHFTPDSRLITEDISPLL